ncbi:MAG TPA: S4 domain-containing protein, partial [Prochlorococcaceae cyanobacterium AMR_MDS_5431]|nr:S4 domain-containing protein [Prochlorococcaceae cyanobacterium AMR_MDS_5431]
MILQRLQKVIAASGLCSRRQAEALIREGRVKVNGHIAYIGDCVQSSDHIEVNEKTLQSPTSSITLLVNKPIGVISSCKDPQGRPTILDLIPARMYSGQRLYPIGRLDSNSRGALLLTTSGELTLQLTHPRYLHSKTYKVWVKGYLNSNVLRQWEEGIFIDEVLTNKSSIKIKSTKRNSTLLELTLT